MKRVLLISAMALLLASCVKEAGDVPGGNDPSVTAVTNYLTVNLVAANRVGTRATTSATDPDNYTDGEETESQVEMIRFFFFDGNGNAVGAWKLSGNGGYESFVDWRPTAGDIDNNGDPDHTVSTILSATLGIHATTQPALVLAVINPSQNVLALGTGNVTGDVKGPNLSMIREALADFNTSGQTGAGTFVMSNSVFVDNDNTVVDAVALKSENFTHDIAEAQANPVTIFVERVLARLDLSIGLTPAGTVTNEDGTTSVIYSTKKPDAATGPVDPDAPGQVDEPGDSGNTGDSGEESEGKYLVDGEEVSIYVKLLGWNITATPDKSRLVKSISNTWTTADLFGTSNPLNLWNTPDYHRSFWAINPDADDYGYRYGMFNKNTNSGNAQPAAALPVPAAGESSTVYLHENAAVSADDPAASTPSQVIIAAQLVDKEGNPFDLAEWAYKKYRLGSLKTLFVGTTLKNLWKKSTSATGATNYDSIASDDLTFTPTEPAEDGSGSYYVKVVLAEPAEGAPEIEWQFKGDDGSYTPMTEEEVNAYIFDRINRVMVWTKGYTYYFFDIRHLGDLGKPGYLGVVRNHLYKATVKSLTGLGTPVYDPDNEVIYPEKPEYDESLVTAEVKVLQWRIVTQEYDLSW